MQCVWNDLIIDVNGETVLLDPHGAAFCPAHRALIVADMHFEKGTSYARSGQFLPPYDSRATLLKLAEVVGRHQPSVIIALGDSFHDRDAGARMGRIHLKHGHQALLPKGAAYRFTATKTGVLLVQTIAGPLTQFRWAEICQTK